MYPEPRVFLLVALIAVLSVSGVVPFNSDRGQRSRANHTSDRIVFGDHSDDSDNSVAETDNEPRLRVAESPLRRSTTTLGPPMTFRGRAPPNTAAERAVAATSPTPTTTEARWYRKLIPSAMPNFITRVGDFFGKKKSTAGPAVPTTEATAPLLETIDEGSEEGMERPVNGTMTLDDIDTRVIIDAPRISGDCPNGFRRSGSGKCRPEF